MRHRGPDCRGIEHVEVGAHAFAHKAAIGEAPRESRRERDHAHCLFDGELLAVADPMPQEMGVDRRIRDLAQVRSRIREGHHRARMLHHRERHVGVLWIHARLDEHDVEVGLEC